MYLLSLSKNKLQIHKNTRTVLFTPYIWNKIEYINWNIMRWLCFTKTIILEVYWVLCKKLYSDFANLFWYAITFRRQ